VELRWEEGEEESAACRTLLGQHVEAWRGRSLDGGVTGCSGGAGSDWSAVRRSDGEGAVWWWRCCQDGMGGWWCCLEEWPSCSRRSRSQQLPNDAAEVWAREGTR
jgi:hypothetical protein